jgi:hypothetical protein
MQILLLLLSQSRVSHLHGLKTKTRSAAVCTTQTRKPGIVPVTWELFRDVLCHPSPRVRFVRHAKHAHMHDAPNVENPTFAQALARLLNARCTHSWHYPMLNHIFFQTATRPLNFAVQRCER